jgi:hypothetical protein
MAIVTESNNGKQFIRFINMMVIISAVHKMAIVTESNNGKQFIRFINMMVIISNIPPLPLKGIVSRGWIFFEGQKGKPVIFVCALAVFF